MENNKYYSLEQSEDSERFLNYHNYKELPSAIIETTTDMSLVVNKTNKTFWINCPKQLENAKQLATVTPTTLNEIRKWHKK